MVDYDTFECIGEDMTFKRILQNNKQPQDLKVLKDKSGKSLNDSFESVKW